MDVGAYLKTALGLFIVVAITLTITDRVNTNFQSMNESIVDNQSKLTSTNFKDASFTFWDVFFGMLLVAFIGFSVMMARLIPSTPLFMIFSFFALLILPFMAMIVENVWTEFALSSTISPTIDQMTFMPFILDHLTVVTLIYSVLVGIALLTKEGEAISLYDIK